MKKILLLDNEELSILETLVRVSSLKCKDNLFKCKLIRLLKKFKKGDK